MRKSIVALIAVGTIAVGVVFVVGSSTRRGAVSQSTRPSAAAPKTDTVQLAVGNATLAVELAQTPEEWTLGLSHRTALPEDTGMLFIFQGTAPKIFWMKDTLIPLDIIWIRENRVVGITGDVQPESGIPDAQLHRYRSPGLIDQVLEVNAGWAKQNVIRVGDHADFVPK